MSAGRCAAGTVLWLLLMISPVTAIMREMTLDELAQGADLIVKGKVIATEARWVEDQRGKHVYTYVMVLPDTRLKGAPPNGVLKIEVRGGTVGEMEEWVEDQPSFAKGEEVVLFLGSSPLQVFGNFQGKYSVLSGNVFFKSKPMDVNTFLETIRKSLAKADPPPSKPQPQILAEDKPPEAASGPTAVSAPPIPLVMAETQPSAPENKSVGAIRAEAAATTDGVLLSRKAAAKIVAPQIIRQTVPLPESAAGGKGPRKQIISQSMSPATFQDTDMDAYLGSITYNVWADGTLDAGASASVWANVYVAPAGGTWQLVLHYPAVIFPVGVPVTGPTLPFTISNQPTGDYYIRMDTGITVWDSEGNPTDDFSQGQPLLHHFESSAEDTQHTPTIIESAAWTTKKDLDGDGYNQTARLLWTANLEPPLQGSSEVFERIFRDTPSGPELVLEARKYTLAGPVSRYYDIPAPGPKNTYQYWIELYRTLPKGQRVQSGGTHPMDIKMESPNEDQPIAQITNVSWTNPRDMDVDQYSRYAYLTWNRAVSGGDQPLYVFERIYYRPTSGGDWIIFASTPVNTIKGQNNLTSWKISGLSRNLYDFWIGIYRYGPNGYDQFKDPSNAPVLKGYRLENDAQDERVTINDWSRDKFVDRDRDIYYRSFRLNWRLKTSGSSVKATSKIYGKRTGTSTWGSPFFQIPSQTVSGLSSANSTTVTASARGYYDLRIEVWKDNHTKADTILNIVYPTINALEPEAEDGGPYITNINPAKASAGTGAQVTITGDGFGATQGDKVAQFTHEPDNLLVDAPIVSWSDTKIVAKVPVTASSGRVYVRPRSGTLQASDGFNFRVTFGYLGTGHYWSSPSVSIYINENTADCTGEGLAVRRGMTTWNAVGSGFFLSSAGATTRVGATANNINEASWVNTLGAGTIALTTIWRRLGTIDETDVEFNDLNYLWNTSTPVPANRMDVQTIAVHELGHVAGLADLYGNYGDNVYDPSKIMYGFCSNGRNHRVLHADDVAGLRWLYAGGPASTLPGEGAIDLAYGPPLTITSCDFAPAAPATVKPGEKISLGALIENDGVKKTPYVWLECWVSKSGDPMKLDGLLIESDLIPPLEPGKGRSYVATKSVLDLPPGEYTVVFVAHPAGAKDVVSPSDSRVAVPGKRLVIGSK